MRSTYKQLGDFITPCNEKNEGNKIKELRGISNQKHFQKAKTNIIGVDLSKYRIVRRGQFAFNRATTRNGDKISIALRKGNDCIVSPSYRIFKSKDENVLNSEYLMMWFRRPEFDRYARFKSHGSAHEFFDLDEMFEVELPIPTIEKQRAIVKEYNTVVNRIKLNEQLNQKLEETAQALYKHWFVDFEFPNEEGKPYKSSGGKMVYNEELNKEIPEGWSQSSLGEFAKIEMGQSPKGESYNFEGLGIPLVNGPVEFGRYFPSKQKWTNAPTKMSELGDLIVCVRGSTTGRYVKSDGAYCLGRGVCSIRSDYQEYVDQSFKLGIQELLGLTTGSTFPNWDRATLSSFNIIKPSNYVIDRYCDISSCLEKKVSIHNQEVTGLELLLNLVLSKMAQVEEEEVLFN